MDLDAEGIQVGVDYYRPLWHYDRGGIIQPQFSDLKFGHSTMVSMEEILDRIKAQKRVDPVDNASV